MARLSQLAVSNAVADWLAPQYLLAAREELTASQGQRRWEILRAMVQDRSVLRRDDHAAARLQLDREELDWQRASRQSQKEQEFLAWAPSPEIRKDLLPEFTRGISPETM